MLKSHLEREKEKQHQYEKRVADLTEELVITQANLQQAVSKLNQTCAERDNYQGKVNDAINKMSQYREQIKDKEERIE